MEPEIIALYTLLGTAVFAVILSCIIEYRRWLVDRRRKKHDNEVLYGSAMEDLSKGDFAGALSTFLILGDWKDSRAKASDCVNRLAEIQGAYYELTKNRR